MKQFNITVYNTVDIEDGGMTRIEYKSHVIQIFYGNQLWHCVMSEDGQEVLKETTCLLEAISYINKIKGD